MRLASSILFAFLDEKVGFFILLGANFHFMWCRLPASCVSSRFASFLVCMWTKRFREEEEAEALKPKGWFIVYSRFACCKFRVGLRLV